MEQGSEGHDHLLMLYWQAFYLCVCVYVCPVLAEDTIKIGLD